MTDEKKDSIQKSIDEFSEWQDNQYNPGHWIGGITPNNLLTPRKPRIVGAALIIIALSTMIGFITMLLSFLEEYANSLLIEKIYNIVLLILVGGFALLLLVGGIRKVVKPIGGKK